MIDIKLPQPKNTKIKICSYCNEEIYYKEDKINYVKDYGRGIFCNLCGTFIKIPKQINGNVRLSNRYIGSGRGYSRRYKKIFNRKIVIGIMIIILFIPCSYMLLTIPSPFNTIEQKTYSTFYVLDNKTGYDISKEIPISIHVQKNEINTKKDLYNMSNFRTLIDSQMAIDLQVDLRPFDHIWIEINSNNIHPNYTNELGLFLGGTNYIFSFYAYPNNITNIYGSFMEV